ncbi:hypothetical protein L9F63_020362, partial [Diploptera punctata]
TIILGTADILQDLGLKARLCIYSTNIEEYELVIPHKVTEDGTFISHHVTHHHFEEFNGNSTTRRMKRSTGKAMLHYYIPVKTYDEPLRLELWPSIDFISPSLIIERRSSSETRKSHPGSSRCHYQGAIRGQPGSQVAVSACDGL